MFGIFFAEQLKDQNTKYRSYLNSLPTTVSNFPELFTQDDLKELEGSDLMLQRINNKNELVRKDYIALCDAEPDIKDFISFTEFQKGCIYASNRAYDLAFTDGSIRQVLIPFIELSPINYGLAANVKCLQIDSYLKLQACRNIRRGEIIVQQQSNACNSSVFLNSGFLADNNYDKNSVLIECQLDPKDKFISSKLDLIRDTEPVQKFLLRENFTVRDSYEFISWLRFLTFDEE